MTSKPVLEPAAQHVSVCGAAAREDAQVVTRPPQEALPEARPVPSEIRGSDERRPRHTAAFRAPSVYRIR